MSKSSIKSALRPVQARVAKSLAEGLSVSEAATEHDLDVSTIYAWRRGNPIFRQAVEDAQKSYTDSILGPGRRCEDMALSALRDLIGNPETSPEIRVQTCLAVLNLASASTRKK